MKNADKYENARNALSNPELTAYLEGVIAGKPKRAAAAIRVLAERIGEIREVFPEAFRNNQLDYLCLTAHGLVALEVQVEPAEKDFLARALFYLA